MTSFGAACFPAALIAYIDALGVSDSVFIWRWDAWAYAALFLMSAGVAKLRIVLPHTDVPEMNRKNWRYRAALLTAIVGYAAIVSFLLFSQWVSGYMPEMLSDQPTFIVFLFAGVMIVPWLAMRRVGYRRLVRSKLLRIFWEEVGGMDAPRDEKAVNAPIWIAYYLIVAGVVCIAFAAASFFAGWHGH